MRKLLLDVTPMSKHGEYRFLWVGMVCTAVATHVSTLTVGLQVYDLTGSTFNVGLVGLFAVVPLICLGLYGGAIVDAFDRRKVIICSTLGLFAVGLGFAIHAHRDEPSVVVLYALVALQNGFFAISNPARHAIVPRLLPPDLLPAANALGNLSSNLGLTVGPLIGAVLVSRVDYSAAYAAQALFLLVAVLSLIRLPSIPTGPERRPAGFRSMVEGLNFLRTRSNVRMTFLIDLCAMILALPRVLFPALAAGVLGGGAGTVGALLTALAAGSIVAGVLSGPLGSVRRQGLAIAGAGMVWAGSVVLFGCAVVVDPPGSVGPVSVLTASAVGLLFVCGAADTVSSVFRTTILQAATPDHLRGRMQGLFVVIVAGGPRLGDLVLGSLAEATSEGLAALLGGVLCGGCIVFLCVVQPGFVRYDARNPVP